METTTMANGNGVTMMRDVLFNIPNIIGYIRVTLFLAGIWQIQSNDNYIFGSSMYVLNCILDELDGRCARRYKQCTQFGALLDIILDVVCMTIWKVGVLTQRYPQYAMAIYFHAAITMMAEWMHHHGSQVGVAIYNPQKGNTSSALLNFYYSGFSGTFGSFVVWVYWIFWLMLYIVSYTSGPTVPTFGIGLWELILLLSTPATIFRFGITLVKIRNAVDIMVSLDLPIQTHLQYIDNKAE